MARLRRDPLGVFAELKEEQGDVARIPFGRSDFFLVSHPDLIKRVLVTNERAYVREAFAYKSWRAEPQFPAAGGLLQPYADRAVHLRARRALQPLFRRSTVDPHWPELLALAQDGVEQWREGSEIDVIDAAYELVLPMVTRAHLGRDLDMPTSELARCLRTCAAATVEFDSLAYRLAERVRLRRLQRLAEAREAVLDVLSRVLDDARRGHAGADDLATLLVQVGDSEGLSERELALELFGHVLNSPDTSVSAIAWTIVLLTRHRPVLDRLREELDAVLANGRQPAADELTYTRAVVAETLRLYPSTWRLKRRAVLDHELGGQRIRRGAHVWISPPLLHRDERWWSSPDEYRPERWLDGGAPRQSEFVYLPFGAGSRKCLGQQIAWRELTAILAAVFSRWDLRLAPGTQVTPRAAQTLRPAGSLRVQIGRRTSP